VYESRCFENPDYSQLDDFCQLQNKRKFVFVTSSEVVRNFAALLSEGPNDSIGVEMCFLKNLESDVRPHKAKGVNKELSFIAIGPGTSNAVKQYFPGFDCCHPEEMSYNAMIKLLEKIIFK
ncbi:MAG TPA: hypothetical protein V6C96_05000, partial [Vampirovibrionales bacterium]